MKVKKVLLVIAIASTIIAGCSSKKTEEQAPPAAVEQSVMEEEIVEVVHEIPEPYIKAIEKINNGDVNTALTYLDLTIKDFPDTEYVLNSYILKSYILSSQFTGEVKMFISYSDGGAKYHKGLFVTKEGIKELLRVLDESKAKQELLLKQLDESMRYVVENYDGTNELTLTETVISYPKPPDGTLEDFSENFKIVGYPIPSTEDVRIVTNSYEKLYLYYQSETFDKNKVKFVDLFYYSAHALKVGGKSDISKTLLLEVMKLTETDKYNELRLETEKKLASID